MQDIGNRTGGHGTGHHEGSVIRMVVGKVKKYCFYDDRTKDVQYLRGNLKLCEKLILRGYDIVYLPDDVPTQPYAIYDENDEVYSCMEQLIFNNRRSAEIVLEYILKDTHHCMCTPRRYIDVYPRVQSV